MKARSSKEDRKCERGLVSFQHLEKCFSDTLRTWDRSVEGFRNHIAIEWSLKGVSGRDAAFCSAVSGAA